MRYQSCIRHMFSYAAAAAATKSLQSCLTLCNPRDGSPPGSSVPGILQARTLEWVAISFSNAWKWKVKVKTLSRVWLCVTPWTAAYQAPPPMGFSRQENKNKSFHYKAFTQIWVYLVSGHLESRGRNTRLAEELGMPEVSVLRVARQPPHFQTPCPVYRKQGVRATDLLPRQLGLFAWEGKLGTCIPGQHWARQSVQEKWVLSSLASFKRIQGTARWERGWMTKPWGCMLTALFPRINGFHETHASLILFCSIYLVRALEVGVMKGPLHFTPVSLESSESLRVQFFQSFRIDMDSSDFNPKLLFSSIYFKTNFFQTDSFCWHSVYPALFISERAWIQTQSLLSCFWNPVTWRDTWAHFATKMICSQCLLAQVHIKWPGMW